MENHYINDIRNDFKNITFSNYQKSKARIELLNCIYDNKIENANYWIAEFICAGHFLDIWEIIILYSSKFIHSGNPKLFIYLNMRYKNFTNIINSGYSNNIIVLRNNIKIRKLFAEIVSTLCYSNKKHIYQQIKLNKTEEFDLTNISNKFKAPNVSYVKNIFKDDDPNELFIPFNELIYNINIKNSIECCYWYEWIIEYENICKKKKKKCICQARTYAPNGTHNDIIWIIWDILFYYANENNSILNNKNNLPIINKIIDSLYNLFIIKYKASFKTKRKYIIYFAFSILIDTIDYNIPITNYSENIKAIVDKINNLYRDIKKNEISPNTDYLFKDIKKTNMEKTIEKIEMINNL